MRGWLLDTNVVSELARASDDAKVVAWAEAQSEHSIYISVLTIAEFERGSPRCRRTHRPGSAWKRPS